ncbi:FAD-dependent oxidoreductase [Paenibacillus sp. VTT E-133280]|uniref:FAD-dependent oxidoreductase n=1 Tax=Paenibacillus sp. VTT E-133280 TaxID=1986222 RepID=UPI00211B727F|nr:FAD-dependent oxidoreductase [Paenibacillus sp. VTT E-133280]
MKELICIIVGGGYAGINAVNVIRKTFKGEASQRPLRLILIDKNPYHFRKVLLFKPAAGDEDIIVPLTRLFPVGVEFVQATVTKIESEKRRLLYQDAEGIENSMKYDILVLTVGSVVRQPDPDQGGWHWRVWMPHGRSERRGARICKKPLRKQTRKSGRD